MKREENACFYDIQFSIRCFVFLTDMQNCMYHWSRKNLNSTLSFWASNSLLLLAWGHLLIIVHVVNDFVRGRLACTLAYWVSKL